jgi:hypothetical protein
VVLHPLEDNQAVTVLRLDDRLLNLEVSARAHLLDLQLEQALDRLRQALLHLTHADRAPPLVHQMRLDDHLGEEVRLPRTSPAMRALIAGRLQEREAPFGGLDLERAQRLITRSIFRISIGAPSTPVCSWC